MIIIGKLIKGTSILDEKMAEVSDQEGSYQDRLERCLVDVCKLLGIEVPMWLSKNTREYVSFRKTSFNADQFYQKVLFDRFEIEIEASK